MKLAEEQKRPATKVLVRGTTYENRDNLAPTFFDDILKYEGTRLGDQEILGKLIDPEEEGIVKRSQWRMWKADAPLPKFVAIVMSLDTAFTERTYDRKTREADPSASEVWGLFQIKTEFHVMLLDAWDDYLGLPDLVKRVREEMQVTYGAIDKPVLGGPLVPSRYELPGVATGKSIDLAMVEDKGSGISLRQTLALENLLLNPYNPGKADKLARVHQVTPMFAHGRVWAVESEKRPGTYKSWAEKVISQVCSYHGEGTVDHDDYIDAMSQALNYFMRNYINSWVKPNKDDVIPGEYPRPVGFDDPNVIQLKTGTNPYDC
jgi:predicted phage terminase large subunit-like protein